MSSSEKRTQLTMALMTQFRYVSANSVMFSQAVADKVGLHSTDNECLDFLLLNGASTAGQLSAMTGLTTGAMTAVIDRLEKAGYVHREHSKDDRRKVIVVPNVEKINAEITSYTMPMGQALFDIAVDFTEEELDAMLRFVIKANAAATQIIAATRKK